MGLILVFAFRGFLRGTVAQVFVLLGLAIAVPVAVWCLRALADHWHGARPALVFAALRWLVAGLAGLAVAAAFQWWGDGLGRAVRKGPLAWLDRLGGAILGGGLGVAIAAGLALLALWIETPPQVGARVGRSATAAPMMAAGTALCAAAERWVPASQWLKHRFVAARARALRERGPSPPPAREGAGTVTSGVAWTNTHCSDSSISA